MQKKQTNFLSLTIFSLIFCSFLFIPNLQAAQGHDFIPVQNRGAGATSAAESGQNKERATTSGQLTIQEHRSVVANFVHSLLDVADREKGGIGEQVRAVAKAQNDASSTVAQAIEKVRNRNKIQTFLFGSDYRNLGALRKEVVQTRNRMGQINRIIKELQNSPEKAELENQLQVLEEEQVKIENFVNAQEGQFSLFGWLVKLFNR